MLHGRDQGFREERCRSVTLANPKTGLQGLHRVSISVAAQRPRPAEGGTGEDGGGEARGRGKRVWGGG